MREFVIKCHTLIFAGITIRQYKQVSARRKDKLTPVGGFSRFGNVTAAIRERNAEMQTQCVLHVKIQREYFAS
ncbi:hypothetical protein D3C77_708580 [compost metagenome]